MNKILNDQLFLDNSAKTIVDESLSMLISTQDPQKVESVVSERIRRFYFTLNSRDPESGLIDTLSSIAVQYVDLLNRQKEVA